jgi:hypothetical protein
MGITIFGAPYIIKNLSHFFYGKIRGYTAYNRNRLCRLGQAGCCAIGGRSHIYIAALCAMAGVAAYIACGPYNRGA